MNSQQISCFLEAVHCRSFSKAAKRLYISQPTFSRAISQLEKELDLQLFSRDTFHGIRLTEAGSVMAEALEKARTDLDAATERAHQIAYLRQIDLVLGLLEGQLLDDTLSDLLSQLRITHPNLKTHIWRGTYCALMKALSNGEVDLVCMPRWQFGDTSKLEIVPHTQIKTVLVAPKRLVGTLEDRTYSISEFPQLTFVTLDTEGHEGMTALLSDLFRSAGIRPKVILAKSMREQIEMVETGEGAILINPYNYICYSPNVCCIEVAELQPQPFSLAWRAGHEPESITLLRPLIDGLGRS